MRRKDDSIYSVLLDFINTHYNSKGLIPTVRDIAAGTGVSVSTVHRYLTVMKEKGELDYNGRRNIETARMKKERPMHCLPVLGRVSCGPGDYEEENVIEYIRLPEAMVGKGEFFALIAKGDSMIDAGVHEGDYVIVRKQHAARTGDIVVALYDEGLSNLKKLEFDSEKNRLYLYSCNSDQEKYPPIYAKNLEIQGVAVMVTHSLLQE